MSYIPTEIKSKHFKTDLNAEYTLLETKRLEFITYFKAIIENPDYYIHFHHRGNTLSYKEYLRQINSLYTIDTEDILQQYLLLSDLFLNLYSFLNFVIREFRYDLRLERSPNFIPNSFKMVRSRVIDVLDKFGYEVKQNDLSNGIYKKNELVEHIISDISNPVLTSSALDFLRYNISTEDKRTKIEEMWKIFEGEIRSKSGNAGECFAKLLNNGLRHTNEQKISNKQIKLYIDSYKDKNELYNKTFDLLIEGFYSYKNSDFKKEISDVEKEK